MRIPLEALCRRLVPAAYGPGPGAVDLAPLVEERIASLDPGDARLVRLLIHLLDHPLAPITTAVGFRRFTRLDPAGQDARLARWERSRVPWLRSAFQALRRLVVSTYYASPGTLAPLGYPGPLHERGPTLPWEGPLPGESDDREPVARGHRRLPEPPPRFVPTGVTEGAALGAETVLRGGVCVVGTGAGGAVAAARLAEAGQDVVMLEEGGWWTPADFTEREHEMVPRLYAEAGGRSTEDLAVVLLQGRAVGGSSLVNWMLTLRTPDWVLEEWVAEHGAEPFAPLSMEPVFERVEDEVHARVVPDDAHSPSNRALLEGARVLGWGAGPRPINALGCVRAGSCGLGCRYGAKRSVFDVYVPRALAAGARLVSDVRVERLEVVERGSRGSPLKRVRAEVLDRQTGRSRGSLTVEAPLVVLAAGAVGTPAILERSGLGGGGVGRYLRLHPTTAVFGLYARDMYAVAGIPQSAVCDEFHRGPDGYGFWLESAPLPPVLGSVAAPGFGDAHRELMADFRRMGPLIVLVRDGAERGRSQGRVTVDRRGRPRVSYRLGAREWDTLRVGMGAAARLHLAAGAREARTLHVTPASIRSGSDLARLERLPLGPNLVGLFSAHVNGTCRVGLDPRESGCTPEGERHGVPGLYVADGSLLPTAPAVNPQLTIMAAATVVAQGILERHRPG